MPWRRAHDRQPAVDRAPEHQSLADIESFSGNKVLTYGWAQRFPRHCRAVCLTRAASKTAKSPRSSSASTRKPTTPTTTFGLGDQATTGAVNFGDFEAQLRIKQGTTAGTFAIDARNGGAFSPTLASGLALNSWYNIWMVVNQRPTRTTFT